MRAVAKTGGNSSSVSIGRALARSAGPTVHCAVAVALISGSLSVDMKCQYHTPTFEVKGRRVNFARLFMPRVSLIIPTFDRPHLLPRAVESARLAGTDVEVIVVDDASSDSTARVCANLQ